MCILYHLRKSNSDLQESREASDHPRTNPIEAWYHETATDRNLKRLCPSSDVQSWHHRQELFESPQTWRNDGRWLLPIDRMRCLAMNWLHTPSRLSKLRTEENTCPRWERWVLFVNGDDAYLWWHSLRDIDHHKESLEHIFPHPVLLVWDKA